MKEPRAGRGVFGLIWWLRLREAAGEYSSGSVDIAERALSRARALVLRQADETEVRSLNLSLGLSSNEFSRACRLHQVKAMNLGHYARHINESLEAAEKSVSTGIEFVKVCFDTTRREVCLTFCPRLLRWTPAISQLRRPSLACMPN
jgi:hypothetical protein